MRKTVAVVGGGPAGMQAALTCAQRGHRVTLFEKKDTLGGQLNFADYAQFKHALAKYKDWLIYQVEKSSIQLALGVPGHPGYAGKGQLRCGHRRPRRHTADSAYPRRSYRNSCL